MKHNIDKKQYRGRVCIFSSAVFYFENSYGQWLNPSWCLSAILLFVHLYLKERMVYYTVVPYFPTVGYIISCEINLVGKDENFFFHFSFFFQWNRVENIRVFFPQWWYYFMKFLYLLWDHNLSLCVYVWVSTIPIIYVLCIHVCVCVCVCVCLYWVICKIYWVGQKACLDLMEKLKWTFWPTQYFLLRPVVKKVWKTWL